MVEDVTEESTSSVLVERLHAGHELLTKFP